MKINIFWFRRDLRLKDNRALEHAAGNGLPVLPVFIFDTEIIDELPADDPRITFIYERLFNINRELAKSGGSILVLKGDSLQEWEKLVSLFDINAVYANKDYEPYSIERDLKIKSILKKRDIEFYLYKDQVIFEEDEIVKNDGTPYTVFTPYRKSWLNKLAMNEPLRTVHKNKNIFFADPGTKFPGMEELQLRPGIRKVRPYDLSVIRDYDKFRDYPAADRTSYLSPHLRFGTISIRYLVKIAHEQNMVFLGELIWREFFMQILFHFPGVVTENFRTAYRNLEWRNDETDFRRWCNGETGYPMVDAGMRELNETGYMHNRVRMITSGFLCKHLLIDWRWGESYFARNLLDYELSSNNGNWQWAAGTGCDAVPYFRIFNPVIQMKRFDKNGEYVSKWIKELNSPFYAGQIIDHEYARKRALKTYSAAIKSFQ